MLGLILSLLVSTSNAAPTNLKNIESGRNENGFFVDLNFSGPIEQDKVTLDFINETIQVNINDASLVAKRRSESYNDELVRSLFTYQASAGLIRSRIILKKGVFADRYRDLVSITTEGQSIRIQVLTNTNIAAQPPTSFETASDIKTPSDVLQNESASSEAAPVSSVALMNQNLKESEIPIQSEAKSEVVKAKTTPLKRYAASVLIFLLLMVGGFIGFKNWFNKKAIQRPNTQIKMITQHHLGPRKSLAIIRVAGESLLIGVTDQNVNLIKTLSLMDEELPTELPKYFQASLQGAQIEQESLDREEKEEFSIKGVKDFVTGRYGRNKEL